MTDNVNIGVKDCYDFLKILRVFLKGETLQKSENEKEEIPVVN